MKQHNIQRYAWATICESCTDPLQSVLPYSHEGSKYRNCIKCGRFFISILVGAPFAKNEEQGNRKVTRL
jgi:hypothetical protein